MSTYTTFTRWASFHGRTPRLTLYDARPDFGFDDFHVAIESPQAHW